MYKYEKIVYNDNLPIKLYDFFNEESEGNIIEKHWHSSIEILIPLYGKFELWVNGINEEISAGKVYIINSKVIHAINGVKDEKIYKGYALQISYDYMKECCSEVDMFTFQQPDEKANKDLMRALIEIIRFYESKEKYNDIRMKSYLQKVVFILLSKLSREKSDCLKLKDNKCKNKIVKITKYIEDNYQNELTVQQIAGTFKISSGYLSKLFKENLNLTVKKYLDQIRLEHAEEELIETDYSIIDIALENGFPNTKSFCQIFKRKNHMTPAKFRNMMRK